MNLEGSLVAWRSISLEKALIASPGRQCRAALNLGSGDRK